MPTNEELQSGLARARELWAMNRQPNGDPLAYFFYAGSEFGAELVEGIYNSVFSPKNAPTALQTQGSPIPDTDLVRISEREVIERAKLFATIWTLHRSEAGDITRASDNLAAAVALLESRELAQKEMGEK